MPVYVSADDLFADTYGENEYYIASKVAMHFLSVHKYISITCSRYYTGVRGIRHLIEYVVVHGFLNYVYHEPVLVEQFIDMNSGRHDEMVRNMFHFIYDQYFVGHAKHIPFMMIFVAAMNVCRYLVDRRMAKLYTRNTIRLLARVMCGRRFRKDTDIRTLNTFGYENRPNTALFIPVIREVCAREQENLMTELQFMNSLNSVYTEYIHF